MGKVSFIPNKIAKNLISSSLFAFQLLCVYMWSHFSHVRLPVTLCPPGSSFGGILQELLLFSHPVGSSPSWPHGLQRTRPPFSSSSPWVCPSSSPLHQGCRPAISSSETLFSLCPQSFPASGTFLTNHLLESDDQNTGASASASVLAVNVQGWSPLRLTGLMSLLARGFQGSSAPQFLLFLLYRPALTASLDPWEDHGLDSVDLGQQSDVSAFQHTVQFCHRFPAKKQMSSDFMATVTIHSDSGVQEEEISHCFYIFPFHLACSNGAGCHGHSFVLSLGLSRRFHSPPSPSSRGSLVPLHCLPLEWYHLRIWACQCFSRLSWFQLVTHQPGISHDVLLGI